MLKKIKEICRSVEFCDVCPFWTTGDFCIMRRTADNWDIELIEQKIKEYENEHNIT